MNIGNSPSTQDEALIAYVYRLIKARIRWVFVASLLTASMAFLHGSSLAPIYTSKIVLMPVSHSVFRPKNGGQEVRVPTLLGVTAPSESLDQRAAIEALAILRQQEFLVGFSSKYGLREAVLFNTGLDTVFKYDLSLNSDRLESVVLSDGEATKTQGEVGPNKPKLHRAMLSLFSIELDRDNGVVTISSSSTSPIFSAGFLNYLVIELNERFKREASDRSNASLARLRSMRGKTSLVENKQVLDDLIFTTRQDLSVSKIKNEYPFQIVDRPFVPEEPSGPNLLAYVVVGTGVGFFAGCFIVLIRAATHRSVIDR